MGGVIYVVIKIVSQILKWILIYFINLQKKYPQILNGILLTNQEMIFYHLSQKKFLKK